MASLITCTAITAFGLILFVWLGDRLQRSVEEWVAELEGEATGSDGFNAGEVSGFKAADGNTHNQSPRTGRGGK